MPYINNFAIADKVSTTTVVAHAAASRFQHARREWMKENPNAAEQAMPPFLQRLKEQSEQASSTALNMHVIKGAMDAFPPLR